MSDITRFGIDQSTVFHDPPLVGDWLVVMESAHVEALRQAEQRGKADCDSRFWQQGYEQGQRDALAGAVQRVEALTQRYAMEPGHVALVIAAIKGNES